MVHFMPCLSSTNVLSKASTRISPRRGYSRSRMTYTATARTAANADHVQPARACRRPCRSRPAVHWPAPAAKSIAKTTMGGCICCGHRAGGGDVDHRVQRWQEEHARPAVVPPLDRRQPPARPDLCLQLGRVGELRLSGVEIRQLAIHLEAGVQIAPEELAQRRLCALPAAGRDADRRSRCRWSPRRSSARRVVETRSRAREGEGDEQAEQGEHRAFDRSGACLRALGIV